MHHETNNRLLAAIDRLSAPRKVKYMQQNAAGIMCVSETMHDPLLKMLRDAVVGGIGGRGVSAGNDSTRLPFDDGARVLYADIEATIVHWHTQTIGPVPAPRPLPESLLRQWYIAFDRQRVAGLVNEALEHEHTHTVELWARQIDSKFDPPRLIEVTHLVTVEQRDASGSVIHGADGEPILRDVVRPHPCPRCGEQWHFQTDTGDRVSALVIEFREHQEENLADTAAYCRACGVDEWRGLIGIRRLREEIEPQNTNAVDNVSLFGLTDSVA